MVQALLVQDGLRGVNPQPVTHVLVVNGCFTIVVQNSNNLLESLGKLSRNCLLAT